MTHWAMVHGSKRIGLQNAISGRQLPGLFAIVKEMRRQMEVNDFTLEDRSDAGVSASSIPKERS
jgi:hypothetical protein